ncbi:hypothetical protein B0I21_10149 [Sphingobacterium paludis]|uniref:histidine kinase n=2 Tax=Sphingobacterium paludis TaxID=1476465 RepID=A0A4R7D8Z9_9SPHI|nr:hypothetical protein B0I21_10149 [Sphingobacterium paludis]
MRSSVERKLFKQFTLRYAIALSIIAVLTIVSQWRIQQHLSRSLDDSHVINFTARLRTHSQSLSKIALMLQNGYAYESSKKEFVNTLRQWVKVQQSLEDGNKFLELPTYNLGEIKELFELVRHPREEMMQAAEQIVTITDTAQVPPAILLRPYVETILNYEQSYLLGMDLIVFEYDRFARERISRLKETDYIMLGLLLLTLTLEVLFIFYPLSVHIKRVVTDLVRSEEHSSNLSGKLQEAHAQMERSYSEIREVNFALDKATYLVKIDTEGKILYANDKYCHVTRYTMSQLREKPIFYNNKGGEESVIYGHIRNHKKRLEVWQEEIFDYASDGSGFWLDVTLIPVFDQMGSVYQYLVIGNDITKRKNAERENMLLIKEKLRRDTQDQHIRSYAIINGQEKERKRVATEIHDGIGQMLTSLRMKIEQVTDGGGDARLEMSMINSMLNQLITETRRICSDLLPSVLEDFGLLSAIEDLVKTCRDADHATSFILDTNIGQQPLSRELEVTVYRILQESLNNVIKHAQALTVEIYLDTSAEYLNLIVKDNGRGFHFEEQFMHDPRMARKMNGLKGMKERAELLGGTFTISSEQGKGTTIILEIPY